MTYFTLFADNWSFREEQRILTNIRDKLIHQVGVDTQFAEAMDPHSLIDFNRSIGWMDGSYDLDSEFIDQLLVNDTDNTFWTPEERYYVDLWQLEFKWWSDETSLVLNPKWTWNIPKWQRR